MRRLVLGLGFSVLAACQCDSLGVDTTRFACASDADCADGFVCRDLGAGRECTRPGGNAGGGGGTGDGGAAGGGAGDDGGAGGGVGGGTGGGTDGGTSAAHHLAFVTAPQTVAAGACSQALTVETRDADDAPVPVAAPTTVTFVSVPTGLSFFLDPGCTGPAANSVDLAPGTSRGTVYFRGTTEGVYQVQATAPKLAVATQVAVIGLAPVGLVFTSTPPAPLVGGTCFQATVETRDATGAATPVAAAAPVALTATPTGGTRFYADADCTTTTSSATIPSGTASASFWVKPLTGGQATITATASFGMASQALTVLPIVRRSSCVFNPPTTLPDGGTYIDTTASCTIAPPVQNLDHALVFSQAIATANRAGTAQASCHLTSPSVVTCTRSDGASSASVRVQVAEVPQGLRVQRFNPAGCPPSQTLNPPVDPAKTFVLKTLKNDGSSFGAEDTVAALLDADGGRVVMQGGGCRGYALQVAEWDGVTVTRVVPDGGLPRGVYGATLTGLPAASNAVVFLVQPSTTSTRSSLASICDFAVRGWLPSPSSLQVHRGGSTANSRCADSDVEVLVLERVDFGPHAVVQEQTVTLAPGDTTAQVTIAPVDTTRTVVFAGTQLGGGQAAGETDFTFLTRISDATALFELTAADTVTVTRASSGATATFTMYVVELVP